MGLSYERSGGPFLRCTAFEARCCNEIFDCGVFVAAKICDCWMLSFWWECVLCCSCALLIATCLKVQKSCIGLCLPFWYVITSIQLWASTSLLFNRNIMSSFTFYRAIWCCAERSYATVCCLSRHPSIHPSFRLSMTFRYCDQISWNTSKIIFWAIWSNENTPKLGWNRGRVGSIINLQYLQNGARSDQGYYDGLIGSRIRALDWYQNQWPWMVESINKVK